MEDREQAGEMYNKVRVRQFMNILEQLPRLCSPTICGTLSQPTTRAERNSRGADLFEWSLEQKAILSPANITTDTEATDEWQQNVADLNPSWRQQESEMFFSQRTIAPSPMVNTPARVMRKPIRSNFRDLMLDEEPGESATENEEEEEEEPGHLDDEGAHNCVERLNEASDLELQADDTFERMLDGRNDDEADEEVEQEDDDDVDYELDDEDQDMDNLFFSPQPLASSQTQQRMDVFSPDSFSRVMEEDNTLQSTPKTTGSLQRTRPRAGVLD